MPTSLTYIILSTRGCTPWRPAAVMSTTSRKGKSLPWIFTGHPKCTGHTKLVCFARPKASAPVNPFPRPHKRSSRKDNSTQDLSWRLQVRLRCRVSPTTGSGILTGFPFDRQSKLLVFVTELTYLLGSTDPCPSTVHTEPFSTSVFKVLI